MPDTFHVYKDNADEWRWKRVAANGQEVADSGEGYEHRVDAVNAANREATGAYPTGDIPRVEIDDGES